MKQTLKSIDFNPFWRVLTLHNFAKIQRFVQTPFRSCVFEKKIIFEDGFQQQKICLTSRSSLSIWNDFQASEDADRGLGGEEDGVIRLAHVTAEDALKKTGPVSQSQKHQGLALATKPVNPPENLGEKNNRLPWLPGVFWHSKISTIYVSRELLALEWD